MSANAALLFLPVGDNAARAFGIDARERACRLATNAGFECVDEVREGAAALVASLGYAWDPVWLRVMRGRPRTVLTSNGKAVMAHVPAGEDAAPVIAALANGAAVAGYERSTRRLPRSNTMSLESASVRSFSRSTPATRSRSSALPMTRPTRA
jgi:hypothetical protein